MHYGKKMGRLRKRDALDNVRNGESFAPCELGVHVDVTLTPTTYLNANTALQNLSRNKEHERDEGVDSVSKSPRPQSNRASIGCAGQQA